MKVFSIVVLLLLVFVSQSQAQSCGQGISGEIICNAEPTNLNGLADTPFVNCRVLIPNFGNLHRNYDAKFRACRAKAIQLGFVGEEQRACSAICMKL